MIPKRSSCIGQPAIELLHSWTNPHWNGWLANQSEKEPRPWPWHIGESSSFLPNFSPASITKAVPRSSPWMEVWDLKTVSVITNAYCWFLGCCCHFAIFQQHPWVEMTYKVLSGSYSSVWKGLFFCTFSTCSSPWQNRMLSAKRICWSKGSLGFFMVPSGSLLL